MIVSAIIATVALLPLCVIIAAGKGDALIAGYNTASEKERALCNVKRLRGIVAVLLLVVVAIFWLPFAIGDSVPLGHKELFACQIVAITVAAIVAVVLANTWAKKKC